MKVVLIRHAEAVVLGENGTETDYDRMLTPHGCTQSVSLGEGLKRIGCVPDAILASPLVRAWQTAELIADSLTPDRDPLRSELLAIGERRPKRLTKNVNEWQAKTIFLVGHMPDLGDYAAYLLGAEDDAVDFDKAAAACISFGDAAEKRGGTLKWLVTPEWLMPTLP